MADERLIEIVEEIENHARESGDHPAPWDMGYIAGLASALLIASDLSASESPDKRPMV